MGHFVDDVLACGRYATGDLSEVSQEKGRFGTRSVACAPNGDEGSGNLHSRPKLPSNREPAHHAGAFAFRSRSAGCWVSTLEPKSECVSGRRSLWGSIFCKLCGSARSDPPAPPITALLLSLRGVSWALHKGQRFAVAIRRRRFFQNGSFACVVTVFGVPRKIAPTLPRRFDGLGFHGLGFDDGADGFL